MSTPTVSGPDLSDALRSSALSTIFRGKLCETLLQNRPLLAFAKGSVIYEVGDDRHGVFFVQRGVVKVGTVTSEGGEVIFDIRKEGDILGELFLCDGVHRDRAVALEATEVIAVQYDEVLDGLQQNRPALEEFLGVVCRVLSATYDQISLLSSGGTLDRLVKVLLRLAKELGRPSGRWVEIDAYLTQEEISQMMGSSRERVSVAMNELRKREVVSYSRLGHLFLDVDLLEGLNQRTQQ